MNPREDPHTEPQHHATNHLGVRGTGPGREDKGRVLDAAGRHCR